MLYIRKNTKVHFIGIGGIGMSGIAEILLQLGYPVSGSDLKETTISSKLRAIGAKIDIGHNAENVVDATVVVYSTAIDHANPEIIEAKRRGIPLIRRAEMLAELMRIKFGLAVAGTHGKTTTTGLLATILHENNFDATYVIGGVVENLGGHAKVGKGDVLVAEADESDGSFLLLGPIMSVITNIDDDHLDYYSVTQNLIKSFCDFANKIPFYGVNIINGQDEKIAEMVKEIKKPWIAFGIEKEGLHSYLPIDYFAKNIEFNSMTTSFDLFYKGEKKERFELLLPGFHNVQNALGAIAICHQLGLDFSNIAKGVQKFKSVGRRLEQVFNDFNVEIVDDYAHHPTAVLKTIQTIRAVKEGEVVVLFEPHRYTRTENSWKEFLHCFNDADKVYILPIYAASESPIGGINSKRLVEDINKLHPDLASYIEKVDAVKEIINESRKKKGPPLTILCLGAGTISKNIREFAKKITI